MKSRQSGAYLSATIDGFFYIHTLIASSAGIKLSEKILSENTG